MTKHDILTLAEKYESLTETASLKKTAAGLSRKDIAKQLDKAKKEYQHHKDRHDAADAQKSTLERDCMDAKDKMLAARKTVLRNHDLLRGMDLSGADEVRFRGNDVSYVKDKKEYNAKFDHEGNCSLTPYKRHEDKADAKDEKKEEEKEDEADVNDAYDYFR